MANEQAEVAGTDNSAGKEIEVSRAGRSIKLTLTGDHGGDGYFLGAVVKAFEAMTDAPLSGVDDKTYDNACKRMLVAANALPMEHLQKAQCLRLLLSCARP